MKKFLLAAVILILLTLDWAALHDILIANEPDYIAEYAILAVSAVVFAVMIFVVLKNRTLQRS